MVVIILVARWSLYFTLNLLVFLVPYSNHICILLLLCCIWLLHLKIWGVSFNWTAVWYRLLVSSVLLELYWMHFKEILCARWSIIFFVLWRVRHNWMIILRVRLIKFWGEWKEVRWEIETNSIVWNWSFIILFRN